MFKKLEESINRENIQRMVKTFYPTILADELVAPFFIEKLGDDINSQVWQEHLTLLGDFWAFVALGDTKYQGHPLAPHFYISGLSRRAFEQWLSLFHQAVDRVYTPNAGEFFKMRSSNIAENFMNNLGL